jgi:hypothetical protein
VRRRFRGGPLRIFGICLLVAAGGVFGADKGTMTPAVYRRGADQTFLTFPEWFLVFSPAEYAAFVKTKTPDGFVFWGHIGQFWKSYAIVAAETRRDRYPANPGYHLMINVIGISTTVEYALRSYYETVVGRITAASTRGELTDEDRYGARVAQEYVDFIRVRPWYEFDFWSRLKGLWATVPWRGRYPLRKWERRYALTTEYVVKAVYGRLIGIATHTVYDPASDVTAVVLQGNPCAKVRSAQALSGGRSLAMLPRYQPFTSAATALAGCGAQFDEIAGNDTIVLVSTISAMTAPAPPGARLLFELPILTQPGLERRAYVVQVAGLAEFLRSAARYGLAPEHVFDY